MNPLESPGVCSPAGIVRRKPSAQHACNGGGGDGGYPDGSAVQGHGLDGYRHSCAPTLAPMMSDGVLLPAAFPLNLSSAMPVPQGPPLPFPAFPPPTADVGAAPVPIPSSSPHTSSALGTHATATRLVLPRAAVPSAHSQPRTQTQTQTPTQTHSPATGASGSSSQNAETVLGAAPSAFSRPSPQDMSRLEALVAAGSASMAAGLASGFTPVAAALSSSPAELAASQGKLAMLMQEYLKPGQSIMQSITGQVGAGVRGLMGEPCVGLPSPSSSTRLGADPHLAAALGGPLVGSGTTSGDEPAANGEQAGSRPSC